ncbi:MAG: hypothetical protein ACYCW6_29150 [Candidatus Xenobia bacterium]
MAYDSDEAGEAGAQRLVEALGLVAQRVRLPAGVKDVTELWQQRGSPRQWVRHLLQTADDQ